MNDIVDVPFVAVPLIPSAEARMGRTSALATRESTDFATVRKHVVTRSAPEGAGLSNGQAPLHQEVITSDEEPHRPLKILHVTETLASGVRSAIFSYALNSPQHEHLLAYRLRAGLDDERGMPSIFTRTEALPSRQPLAIAKLLRLVSSMRPDVVHAHSSIAGAWVRAFIKGPRIVYSPHCFAFERRDTPGLIRASYLAAEYILARRPQVVAVVSEREAALARRLRTRAGVVYVPHSVPGRQDFAPADRVADDLPQDIAPVPSRLTVVTAGRIGPQKDPDYLLRVKAKVSEALNLDWLWVGEGDRQAHEKLRMGGVRVTGWLSRELALAVMSRASVYVHTAAWEGAPVVVAEAASLNVPVIARAIPATVSELPTAMLAATEEDMARRITDVVSAARSRRSVLDAGRRYAMTQTVERQRVALRRLYDETG